MTKARAPGTLQHAMHRVIYVLGQDEVARIATDVVSRPEPYSGRTMYEWANPDSTTILLMPIATALALDRAYRLAGGEDAPFRDAFAQQLDIAVKEADACRRSLVTESATFVREAAEATEALFHAAQPGASPREIHRALVEAQQVEQAARPLRRRLVSFLRNVTSPSSGNAGGDHQ